MISGNPVSFYKHFYYEKIAIQNTYISDISDISDIKIRFIQKKT